MAHLDRFLSALVSNHGSALLLAADDAARVELGTVKRAVTKQPLSGAQVRGLLIEIAPPDARRAIEAEGDVSFEYVMGDARFRVNVTCGEDGEALRVAIAPCVEAPSPVTPQAEALLPRASGAVEAKAGETSEVRVTERGEDASVREELDYLLRQLVERGASDLHLRVAEPPILRLHGEMARLDGRGAMDNGPLEAMLRSIMPERNRIEYDQLNDTDFAYEISGLARFRCNALRERRGAGAVFRVIPARVITADELGLPEEVQRLCQLPRGLVLVTGPTGSGKSTTLCSLIDLVNRTRSDHVITIEDPIEFVHPNKRCIITQRQVGVHTSSFKHALRAALREDPDIILVGELRDLETVSIAIETAETGHLVFGTLHTTSAVSTVDRLIDQFPPDRQAQIRVMLSESLRGVISQVLCKKIGGGRVAAREVLLTIPAISNLIREGKTFQIPSILQTSKRLGMVTLNDALIELVDAKLVEPREAYVKASDKQGFAVMLRQRQHDTSFLESEVAGSAAPAGGQGGGKPDGGLRPPTGRIAAVR